MEYNKTEEKLISGQPSLKMCFFYNSSCEQEHPICSILLDLIGKSGEKKTRGNLYLLTLREFGKNCAQRYNL